MSIRILAIDTTGDHGSLALLEGDCVVEEFALHSSEGFGHVLFGEIDALLKRHGWTLRDIDCFASASGPGSFTGVRVGLTAAKGLAAARGKMVVAVSNLEALASLGHGALRAAMIDAKRGEIYGAVYDAESRPVRAEVVTKQEDWLRALPEGDIEIVSGVRPLAAAVARIAAKKFADGQAQAPADTDANYVRRSDAELFWKDK